MLANLVFFFFLNNQLNLHSLKIITCVIKTQLFYKTMNLDNIFNSAT